MGIGGGRVRCSDGSWRDEGRMMNPNQLLRVCVSRRRVDKVQFALRQAGVSVATLLSEGDGVTPFPLHSVLCL